MMKKIVLLIVAILYSYSMLSFSFRWNVELLTTKNGLSDNTVYDVCYGGNGFVWLSTDRGISRYDGFRFRNYPLVASLDSVSKELPQAVRTLKEANDSLYYAQLYQGGIVAFDAVKEKYLPLSYDASFNRRDIVAFSLSGNALYLGTSKGLFQATTSRKSNPEGEDYMECAVEKSPLVAGKVTSVCGDKNRLYLVIDHQRVIQYDLLSRRQTELMNEKGAGNLFLKNDYLWVGQTGKGVVCYDLKRKTSRLMVLGANQADFDNSYITGVASASKNTYYFTTWSGMYIVRFEKEELVQSPYTLTAFSQNVDNASSVNNKMTGLFWNEQQNMLWISTFGGGVVKCDPGNEMYTRLDQNLGARITGLTEDSRGTIWLVTTDGNVMHSSTGLLSAETTFVLWKKIGTSAEKFCTYKDRNGRIWIGSSRGSVLQINPLTGESLDFRLRLDGDDTFTTSINQFCLDSRNRLWVATRNGLLQADPQTMICKQMRPRNGKLEDQVYAVTEDKEGNIWIGTKNGLKRLEFSGEQVRIEGNYEKECGLEEMAVASIYVNNYNQIYAAYLNTIIRIDGRNKEKVESVYTVLDGLTSGHVSCMVDDLTGNTWAGNNSGIMTIRSGQSSFYNYLLPGDCCVVCRLGDGKLLWANASSLLFFDPANVKMESSKRKLYLTDLKVNGEMVPVGKPFNGQVLLHSVPEMESELVINADNNDFTLFFSDLRYGSMQRKIVYRLVGEEEEWKTKLLAEGLWFKGLKPGKYVLEIKLVYPDASEGEVLKLPITIKGYWYSTIWAILFYGLLLASLAYLGYHTIKAKSIKKQLNQNREMMLKEDLHLERMKREQKKEVEDMRNHILMVFVQELRTPLTLILGPLKDLIKENTPFAARGQVAYRNSLRMLNACNQLLAVYGEGAMADKLEIALYTADKLIDTILLEIRELLKLYAIDFRYEKRIKKDLELFADKGKVEFVVHNLLSNAFNHTHFNGAVSLTLCETAEEGMRYFTVIVEDDAKVEVKVTERYMDMDRKQITDLSAIELGFGAMERILKIHHGKIQFESSLEAGTKVTVSLPIGKEIYEQDANAVFTTPEELAEEVAEAAEVNIREGGEALLPAVTMETLLVEEAVATPAPRGKRTLLIVEDHKDIRLYLKVLFGKEYNLLMATNGQEGVDLAMKELPDLIICDVMMPVKDGFECCREVKEGLDTCNIPFIMLTAKVEDEDIIRGLELGADDYILKPFTPGILKAKVRNLINGRQSLKQMYTKLLMLPGTDTATGVTDAEMEEEVKVEDPFISAVIKIVEENICEADFSVKKLAAEMNMSQPTLYRKVKQSTDFTIIELIRGVRMRRAAVLLKLKKYTVQEVGEMVGYNDIPTFRKHFVDTFGTTPSTYDGSDVEKERA